MPPVLYQWSHGPVLLVDNGFQVVEDVGSPEPRVNPTWDSRLEQLAREKEDTVEDINLLSDKVHSQPLVPHAFSMPSLFPRPVWLLGQGNMGS